MTTTSDDILDFAEREIRRAGLDAVSFRDIAAAIGIKSASVHYHFPTKADLGAGVTQRYAERFVASLGAPDDTSESVSDRVARFADAYVNAYETGGSTCLCAVLGSVSTHLPSSTSEAVLVFYQHLSEWLTTAIDGRQGALDPSLIISILQGAMVLSVATQNRDPLDLARAHVLALAR